MDGEGYTLMNLSRDFFHITIVLPFAFDFSNAISMSCLSSEFNSHLYSPLNSDMQCCSSDTKIKGSLRKIRSGLVRSVKLLKLYKFLFNPSMFQVSEEIVCWEMHGSHTQIAMH